MKFLYLRNQRNETALIEPPNTVNMLQEQQYGADYLLANKDNVTALHHSRVNGHKGVVAFLLKKNLLKKNSIRRSDPRALPKAYRLPQQGGRDCSIVNAPERNRGDVIDLLLDHKADYSFHP